jgi:hypothetical protein
MVGVDAARGLDDLIDRPLVFCALLLDLLQNVEAAPELR